MKHTKGPWKWHREWKEDGIYSGSVGCLNPDILWYGMDGEESIYCPNQANAELIAKAPEMYKQLASARAIMQKFVAFMDEYYSIRGVIEPLRSDSKEDELLKETYAEMKQWMEEK